MNKKCLIQAAIDLAVAVLAGYIMMLVPVTGITSPPPVRELPGKTLMVQMDILSKALQSRSELDVHRPLTDPFGKGTQDA